jgi:hypothetical protein
MKPYETTSGLAVNRLVAGSNPARGANTCSLLFTTFQLSTIVGKTIARSRSSAFARCAGRSKLCGCPNRFAGNCRLLAPRRFVSREGDISSLRRAIAGESASAAATCPRVFSALRLAIRRNEGIGVGVLAAVLLEAAFQARECGGASVERHAQCRPFADHFEDACRP